MFSAPCGLYLAWICCLHSECVVSGRRTLWLVHNLDTLLTWCVVFARRTLWLLPAMTLPVVYGQLMTRDYE